MKSDTDTPSGLEVALEDESWAYLVLEPRSAYDEAMVGLLPISVSQGSDENLTHSAVYCRIKALIALSKTFEPAIPWNDVLEFHYFNQDSTAHPPYPLFVDPPEGWEEMPRYAALVAEYDAAAAACPAEDDEYA